MQQYMFGLLLTVFLGALLREHWDVALFLGVAGAVFGVFTSHNWMNVLRREGLFDRRKHYVPSKNASRRKGWDNG